MSLRLENARKPFNRLPVLYLVLLFAFVQPGILAREPAAEPIANRVVVGTVVSVESPLLTVRLPNLLGYLRVRVRTYKVRQPASLIGLRPGDRISGVLSRTDGMLHRVRRVESMKALERRL